MQKSAFATALNAVTSWKLFGGLGKKVQAPNAVPQLPAPTPKIVPEKYPRVSLFNQGKKKSKKPNYQASILPPQELLGVKYVRTRNGYPIAFPYELRDPRSDLAQGRNFVHHSAGLDLAEALRLSGGQMTINLRAVRIKPARFLSMLKRAAYAFSDAGMEPYRRYLSAIQAWGAPESLFADKLFYRDCVLTGRYGYMIPKAQEMTAAQQGEFPRTHTDLNNTGSFVRSVLYGLPIDLKYNSISPEEFAAPTLIENWGGQYVRFNQRVVAFWKGIISLETLAEIVEDLDVDLLLSLRVVEGVVYASVLIRRVVDLTEEPEFQSIFSTLDGTLSRLGKWVRIQNCEYDMFKAFQAFVPGAAPYKSDLEHSLVEPVETLEMLSNALVPYEDEADTFLGVIKESRRNFYVSSKRNPAIALIAPSNFGKTTLASFLATQQGREVLMVHFTASDVEGSVKWAKEFGGDISAVGLNFQDAKTSKEMLEKIQNLIEQAEKDAKADILRWLLAGAMELPKVISPKYETVAYYAYVTAYIKTFVAEWKEKIYPRRRRHLVIIFDDLVGIPSAKEHIELGNIPFNVGTTVRSLMDLLVKSGRKIGVQTIVTAHAEEELRDEKFPSGFLSAFNLQIDYSEIPHVVTVTVPKTRKVLATNVSVKLPPHIESVLKNVKPVDAAKIKVDNGGW